MTTLDKTYMINVVAVDFLGTSSASAVYSVLKQSSPGPTFVFSPSSTLIFRNNPILISGVAEFSECPIPHEALIYKWRQVSGPFPAHKVQHLLDNANSPQIYFPAYSFEPGSSYVFTVNLQLASDSSKYSEASFTLNIGEQSIIARIAEGSSIVRSNSSSWTLDASPSRDLDKSELTNAQNNLTYAWSCTFFDGDSNIPCTDTLGNLIAFPPVVTVTIPSGLLAVTVDQPYVFTVAVQDFLRLKQTSTASISVITTCEVLPRW